MDYDERIVVRKYIPNMIKHLIEENIIPLRKK